MQNKRNAVRTFVCRQAQKEKRKERRMDLTWKLFWLILTAGWGVCGGGRISPYTWAKTLWGASTSPSTPAFRGNSFAKFAARPTRFVRQDSPKKHFANPWEMSACPCPSHQSDKLMLLYQVSKLLAALFLAYWLFCVSGQRTNDWLIVFCTMIGRRIIGFSSFAWEHFDCTCSLTTK